MDEKKKQAYENHRKNKLKAREFHKCIKETSMNVQRLYGILHEDYYD